MIRGVVAAAAPEMRNPEPDFLPLAVSSASAGDRVAWLGVALPDGVQDGDLLVAVCTAENQYRAIDAPDGWTTALEDLQSQVMLMVCWKVASNEDETIYFYSRNLSNRMGAQVVAFRGQAGPPVVSVGEDVSGATSSAPALLLPSRGYLLCGFVNTAVESLSVLSGPAAMDLLDLSSYYNTRCALFGAPAKTGDTGERQTIWSGSGSAVAASIAVWPAT